MVFDPENVRSPMRPGNLYDGKGSSMANSFRQSSSDHFIGSLKRFHRQMKLERSIPSIHRKSIGVRNWSKLIQ